MRLINFLTLSIALSSAIEATFLEDAKTTANILQKIFYDEETGLWTDYGAKSNDPDKFWWTSANCLSALSLLASLDNSTNDMIFPIIENSFEQTQALNLKQYGTKSFHRPVYSDSLMWAMTWVHNYDLVGDKRYLDAVVDIFQYVAYNGANNETCGGIWWDESHEEQYTLTNVLFFAVITHLATRMENAEYYMAWTLKHWEWMQSVGMIQPDGLVVSGIDKHCKAIPSSPSWSHIQGIAMGGLLELNKAAPNDAYLELTTKIANASIKALSDKNGIITEYHSHGSPDLGIEGPTYKGLYIRHVVLLPQHGLAEDYYVPFLHKQGASIWSKDRSRKDGTIGNVWDRYYRQLEAPGHCAGLDALVAAATV